MGVCSRALYRTSLGLCRAGARSFRTPRPLGKSLLERSWGSEPLLVRFSRHLSSSTYSTEALETPPSDPAEVSEEDPDALAELVKFQELGLDQRLSDALGEEFNITYATPAQDALLKNFFKDRDIILRDTTGSGKTFAITLALVSKALSVADDKATTQSLLLVPNRELAIQIEAWCRRLLGPSFGPRIIQTLFKGKSTDAEQEKLLCEVTPLLIIGTPNKVFDIVNTQRTQHLINLASIKHIVLDEVDHLLRLPSRYAPQKKVDLREKHPKPASLLMKRIFELTRPQVAIMSATLNRGVRFYFNQLNWMELPAYIDGTASIQSPPESLEHMCVVVAAKEVYNLPFKPKKEKLTPEQEELLEEATQEFKDLRASPADGESASPDQEEIIRDDDERLYESVAIAAHSDEVTLGLLFIPNKVPCAPIIKKLVSLGIDAVPLHSYFGSPQPQRTSKKPLLLVGTYYEARGIDIPDVTHVYITGYPGPVKDYLHIAGRAGRMRASHDDQGQQISWGRVVTFLPMAPNRIDRMSLLYRMLSVTPIPYPHLEY